jgi:hypothetical protein
MIAPPSVEAPPSAQSSERTPMSNPANSALPIFYRQPEPLSSQVHAGWRITEGDLSFAAATPSLPVLISEFALASRDYPVLFAETTAAPIALVGLQQENLFVRDGIWADDAYVPAYVRRYPFTTLRSGPDGFILVIDSASERIVHDEQAGSVALFDGDQPSDYTKRVLGFCEHFHADALATEAFARALLEHDLLVERRADITLPNGEKLGVNGFRIVDPERFAALPDDVALAWHRNGWLALVHFHLASLNRFPALLARRAAVAPLAA